MFNSLVLVALCAYFMVKYSWGFDKAYDYLCSKRPSIDVKDGFILQLLNLETRIKEKNAGLKNGTDVVALSRFLDWNPTYLQQAVTAASLSTPLAVPTVKPLWFWEY